jgi:hypothetical protein
MYWLPYFDSGFYSEEVNQLRQWDGTGAVLKTTLGLEIAIFLASVGIPFLMFFFVPGSRQAFLILTLVLLAANLGFGVRVVTALDTFLGHMVALMDGAILAIAYFTSVGSRFHRSGLGLSVAP